ncbi:MAG: hypothetical protein HN704_16315 [Bacteroidetes bacterium]|nr:hypothetical protein [Bacteroidota bacterium]MBT6687231.1 hypothetical protein [Bacteroidota bacterium]MBT7144004.1 hypothetical protein [Bacteroidota bacterium]MBT7493163.1 hypothetical protein [Bacteroidota bacterium]
MKKKLILLKLFIILLISTSFAANDNYPIGARQAAMSNASVCLSDIWSVHHNQAGLTKLKKISLGFHHENKFFNNDFGLQSFALALPTKSGVFAFNLSYFGFTEYNESKIALSYAKSFGEKFSVGIQFDYFNTFINDNFDNQGTMVIEAGIISEPVENLIIGAHIFNPTKSQISKSTEEKVPTIFKIGVAYKFYEKTTICIETEKDIDFSSVFKIGIEYLIVKNVLLRTGFRTNPANFSFGIGYLFRKFSADIAFSRHEIFGTTPHFSIGYTF